MFVKFLLLLLSISNQTHQRAFKRTHTNVGRSLDVAHSFGTTNGTIINPFTEEIHAKFQLHEIKLNLLNGWYFSPSFSYSNKFSISIWSKYMFFLCVFTFPISILVLHSNDANNRRTCTNTFLSFTFDFFSLIFSHFSCPIADIFTHHHTRIIFSFVVFTSLHLPTLRMHVALGQR